MVRDIAELRRALDGRRDVVLVPTMGNLHEGHLSLVRAARARGGLVVTSIFVNPLQFGPQEDFASYPRTLERDCDLLFGTGGCDLVFAPSAEEMYSERQVFAVQPPAALGDILEGHYRPGFFAGVCTVVMKLFSIVQPIASVFGRKDYQQLLVIRSMVREFGMPIDILLADTVREPDGLALSSRNSYLNRVQRIEAAQLHGVLQRVSAGARRNRTSWPELERTAIAGLAARGWQPDYVAIRRQCDLGIPEVGDRLVVLGAARLGSTRLIDNVEA
jgi:pantoate--beta-alanine ligase